VKREEHAGNDGECHTAGVERPPLPPPAGRDEEAGDDDEREEEAPGGDGERIGVGEADQRRRDGDAEQREGEDGCGGRAVVLWRQKILISPFVYLLG
jgi:hypothetical protein